VHESGAGAALLQSAAHAFPHDSGGRFASIRCHRLIDRPASPILLAAGIPALEGYMTE